ncbi:MAG TPA: BrnT family toxin [Candidatus Acidoferrales bacterium]|nr:BrnT family toxin [Candidatus Acidoferrales bacterium]
MSREFTWSERKRSLNIKQHGLDFVDAPAVFGGLTFTFEGDRFSYNEQRFVTLGLLAGVPVSIVHTETAHEIRIISFRQATHRETQIFFDAVKN